MTRPTIQKLREDNDDKLPAYAWPGGYPICYTDKENSMICPECANKEDLEPPVTDWFIFYEGASEQCDECYKWISSAYGDPEEDNNEN